MNKNGRTEQRISKEIHRERNKIIYYYKFYLKPGSLKEFSNMSISNGVFFPTKSGQPLIKLSSCNMRQDNLAKRSQLNRY